jgi:Flp pilus assembly protein TadG
MSGIWRFFEAHARIRRDNHLSGAECGQALVEFAMCLSLLAFIVLGVMEFGQISFTSIELENAAKAGVQYGAESGFTAEDTTGIQNAAQAAAPNLSGMSVTSSYSCVCSDGTASTCALTDCSNTHIEESVTVNTSYSLAPFIHVPAFTQVIHTSALPTSITLTGRAVQKCGQ